MQNKTNEGQKVVSPFLKRVAKWAIFVLNRARVWRPRRHIFTQTFLEPPLGGHWAADWAMQWLNILRNIDYKDTFFLIECIATPNRWNGIVIYILCVLKRDDWHYFWLQRESITWPTGIPKFPKLLLFFAYETWQDQFWCFLKHYFYSNVLFLKTLKENCVSVSFLSDIALKALLTIHGKWICFYLTYK